MDWELGGLMMRAVLLLLLALLATEASAGIFGPSSYDACVKKYAVPAQDDSAANAAGGWCHVLFPRDGEAAAEQYRRDRAQCILDDIGDVKTESGLGQLTATCARKFPQPPPAWAQ
jgi:hypothetical protein